MDFWKLKEGPRLASIMLRKAAGATCTGLQCWTAGGLCFARALNMPWKAGRARPLVVPVSLADVALHVRVQLAIPS